MEQYVVQPPTPPQNPTALEPPAGKKELFLAGFMLVCGLFLWNSFCYGGLNLGVSIAAGCSIVASFVYLLCCGHRPGFYSVCLLLLSLISVVGFSRSDDGFVKFIMLCFVIVGSNLGLCLTAKKNLWASGSVRSLLDAPRTVIMFGIARAPQQTGSLFRAMHSSGKFGKKSGAILLGLCISTPILAIMVFLLTRADAAFDGLMQLLPEFKVRHFLNTVIFGALVSCFLYARAAALHSKKAAVQTPRTRKGVNALTVNTVLSAVCLLYCVYLCSQLAYLSGGFAGILPEEFTMAEYARRGFFEMAILSFCNLTVMVLSLGLVEKTNRSPLATRLLCLFLGIVTLFLIVTASAKMFLYIESYGLSRLRVLTQIIMLFLAITTGILMVWLFLPKLPYMRAILLAALVIGATTLWMDVNTLVASYNVNSYLNGKYDTIDVSYLNSLGDSALPYLAKLAQNAPDEKVANRAENCLKGDSSDSLIAFLLGRSDEEDDFRDWNYIRHIAKQYRPASED